MFYVIIMKLLKDYIKFIFYLNVNESLIGSEEKKT